MAFQLEDLPRLLVTGMQAGVAHGTLDLRSRLEEGWIMLLYAGGDRFIAGRLVRHDAVTGAAHFVPDQPRDLEVLRANHSYPALDSYWGERAELVADRAREWQRSRFEPRENWDHEHCAICWEKIATYAQPFGYRDQNDEWVCEACHARYVEQRSFDFVRENLKELVRDSHAAE